MALHRTGIADAGGIVGIGRVRGRGIASEASKYCLSERAEGIGTVLDALLRHHG